jgi:hypothetical protein
VAVKFQSLYARSYIKLEEATHLFYGLLGPIEIHLILLMEGLEARVVLDALNDGCSLTAQHTVKYTK